MSLLRRQSMFDALQAMLTEVLTFKCFLQLRFRRPLMIGSSFVDSDFDVPFVDFALATSMHTRSDTT